MWLIFDRPIKFKVGESQNFSTTKTADGKHVAPEKEYQLWAHLLNGIEPIGRIENPKFTEETI